MLPYQVTFMTTGCSQKLYCYTEVLDALMLSLKETSHICNLEFLEKVSVYFQRSFYIKVFLTLAVLK